MGGYDFTYTIPENFMARVVQHLKQSGGNNVIDALQNCKYDFTVLGYAYYEGLRGDNWNKKAVDLVIEGAANDISVLQLRKNLLIKAVGIALKPNQSGFLLKDIYFYDIDVTEDISIPESNTERLENDLRSANAVLSDLIFVGERICSNYLYAINIRENNINDAFRDMLFAKGYNEVKDQTRHGISSAGKDSAEVDLLLSKGGKEIALIEAMVLKGVDTTKITEHICKALINYNALGTPTFIMAYVNVSDFGGFWKRYLAFINGFHYPVDIINPLTERASPNASARIATMVVSKDGYKFPVYFIAFKFSKE